MTYLLINIWFDLFKWNSSFTWGLLMLKYNIIAGTTVQHAWLKCHCKLNRMPLILIFTVHAKLQFTYVNTYPDDPPLIEVPSYEGMDDSEAENLREFLDQEVITCDWLSSKSWSIFWKSFIDLLVCSADLDILCSRSFSHHVKFYSFMFMHKISTRVVCVNEASQVWNLSLDKEA